MWNGRIDADYHLLLTEIDFAILNFVRRDLNVTHLSSTTHNYMRAIPIGNRYLSLFIDKIIKTNKDVTANDVGNHLVNADISVTRKKGNNNVFINTHHLSNSLYLLKNYH